MTSSNIFATDSTTMICFHGQVDCEIDIAQSVWDKNVLESSRP